MNYLVIIFFIVNFGLIKSNGNGVLAVISSPTVSLDRQPRSVNDQERICVESGVRCRNCSFFELCPGPGLRPVAVTECPETVKYCQNGGCTEVKPDISCYEEDYPNSFKCPNEDGHFPNPTDCSKYYICLNNRKYEYVCSGLSVYNSETKSCVRRTLQHRCLTINCKRKNGYVQLQPISRYAFYCINNEFSGFILDCGENKRYDLASSGCLVQCSSEGLLPNDNDPTRFYECVQALGNKFNIYERRCPEVRNGVFSIFDSKVNECINP